MITDPIGGVIVSMLDSSMVDRVFEPWSGQTKDYEIGICCFSVKHAALSSNVSEGTTNLRTDCWFNHLSEGTTNLPTDCWFSHLSEGGDKSTDGLLIQSSVWGERQIYRRTVDSAIFIIIPLNEISSRQDTDGKKCLFGVKHQLLTHNE